MLRETRERYGLTLRDVANALRIRVVYLHALEEGRFLELPGRPYVVGFLRSYAEYFGLDGDEVVRRYREERADTGRPAKLVFPEPPPESKFPIGAMLAILVVVSVLGYGAWQIIGGEGGDTRLTVASVPSDMALESDSLELAGTADPIGESAIPHATDRTMLAALDQPATTQPGTTQPGTTTTRSLAGDAGQAAAPADGLTGDPAPRPMTNELSLADEPADTSGPVIELSSASAASMPGYDDPDYAAGQVGGTPAVDPMVGQAQAHALSPSLLGFPNAGETVVPEDLASFGLGGAVGADPSAVSTVASIQQEATEVFGDINAESRVLLRATADCWIQVNDTNGSDVFTRLLKAGEVYRVPNRDDLLLRMGNAGGLEVIVDGKPLPLLGDHGEVMRNVSLAPDDLLAAL